jgi:hypothetical protein
LGGNGLRLFFAAISAAETASATSARSPVASTVPCAELSPPRAMTSRNDARRWRPRTGRDRQRQLMLSASMSD